MVRKLYIKESISPLTVVLNTDNLYKDRKGNIHKQGKNVETANCNTLRDASNIVMDYIDDNFLTSSEFSGGDVFYNNKRIAKISYNGKVWKNKTTEYTDNELDFIYE